MQVSLILFNNHVILIRRHVQVHVRQCKWLTTNDILSPRFPIVFPKVTLDEQISHMAIGMILQGQDMGCLLIFLGEIERVTKTRRFEVSYLATDSLNKIHYAIIIPKYWFDVPQCCRYPKRETFARFQSICWRKYDYITYVLKPCLTLIRVPSESCTKRQPGPKRPGSLYYATTVNFAKLD